MKSMKTKHTLTRDMMNTKEQVICIKKSEILLYKV